MMEKREEMELLTMYKKAIQVMREIQCDQSLLEKGNIKLNGRLSKTLGRCYMSSGNIEINKEFFYYGKENDIFETILHELSHRVCMSSNDGHGKNWQHVVGQINRKLGTNIKQYADSNKIEYRASLDSKYTTFICTNCNKKHILKTSRLTVSPMEMESKYRCFCGGHITLIK